MNIEFKSKYVTGVDKSCSIGTTKNMKNMKRDTIVNLWMNELHFQTMLGENRFLWKGTSFDAICWSLHSWGVLHQNTEGTFVIYWWYQILAFCPSATSFRHIRFNVQYVYGIQVRIHFKSCTLLCRCIIEWYLSKFYAHYSSCNNTQWVGRLVICLKMLQKCTLKESLC